MHSPDIAAIKRAPLVTERHTGYSEEGSCTSGDDAMGVDWWRRGGGLNEDSRWMVVGVLASR